MKRITLFVMAAMVGSFFACTVNYVGTGQSAKGKMSEANVSDKNSALYNAAFLGNLQAIRTSLNEGADVNAKNNKGATALMGAATMGHIEVVKLLLENGADVNAKDKDGTTALMLALATGRPEIATLLLMPEVKKALESRGIRIDSDAEKVKGTKEDSILGKEGIEAGQPAKAKTPEADVSNKNSKVIAEMQAPFDKGKVESLIADLRTGSGKQSTAASILGAMKDPRVVDLLLKAFAGNENGDFRGWVLEVLEKIGDPRSVPLIINALEDREEWVRSQAASALGKMKDSRAIEPLIAALQDRGDWGFVPVSAARSLAYLKDP